ncbi:type II secretion system F family protein [Rhodococcoides yunnanense]|uniref:type II secretion system F family protein n=1 Tax=Rhodococcoides yunnanense TaxID=278209 RepID=UPI0022B0A195|nr:type ii secretion system integral membrane subunit [Rhodococcus yunnanensis]MCZ4276654.1 type ii secretion system integral membrane subunit [Rhodococcus yunnanensis]
MTAVGVLLCAMALLVSPRPRARVAVLRPEVSRSVDRRSRVVMIAAGVVVALVIALQTGGVHFVAAASIVAATVWKRRRGRGFRRERRRESESLIAGLETVIGELRVGAHPAIACGTAAAECTGSVALSFRRASGRARLGGTAHEGLPAADSAVSRELTILAGAWRVADENGLALVGLLGAARGDLLARNRFRDRTEASLAGARATGTVLAGLPVLGVLLGQAMGASPIDVLLGGGVGGILLVLGSCLGCAGLLWTDAITERVCR